MKNEWATVRNKVGLLNLTSHGKILVKGKDRVGFLHSMLSNDIKNLPVGKCCYTAFLTPKGKMISDLHVYALEEVHLLEMDESNAPKVLERLESFIITENVGLLDVTRLYGMLSLQGPSSEEITKQFPSGVRIFSNDRTGAGGFDMWITIENLNLIRQDIQNLNIPEIGPTVLEILRIETGIPKWGAELDENTIPNEAGLERAISWTKGCYPGQEIVARIKYRGGVQRILSGLIIQGDEIPSRGDRIFKDSNEIGLVTSAAYSFELKSPVALAYLKSSVALEGQDIQIEHENRFLTAKVKRLPFYVKTINPRTVTHEI